MDEISELHRVAVQTLTWPNLSNAPKSKEVAMMQKANNKIDHLEKEIADLKKNPPAQQDGKIWAEGDPTVELNGDYPTGKV